MSIGWVERGHFHSRPSSPGDAGGGTRGVAGAGGQLGAHFPSPGTVTEEPECEGDSPQNKAHPGAWSSYLWPRARGTRTQQPPRRGGWGLRLCCLRAGWVPSSFIHLTPKQSRCWDMSHLPMGRHARSNRALFLLILICTDRGALFPQRVPSR